MHRGIAARQFQRSFVLAEGIEVVDARLDNGLLHIDLEQPIFEPKVRQVAIKTGSDGRSIEAQPVERKGGKGNTR